MHEYVPFRISLQDSRIGVLFIYFTFYSLQNSRPLSKGYNLLNIVNVFFSPVMSSVFTNFIHIKPSHFSTILLAVSMVLSYLSLSPSTLQKRFKLQKVQYELLLCCFVISAHFIWIHANLYVQSVGLNSIWSNRVTR